MSRSGERFLQMQEDAEWEANRIHDEWDTLREKCRESFFDRVELLLGSEALIDAVQALLYRGLYKFSSDAAEQFGRAVRVTLDPSVLWEEYAETYADHWDEEQEEDPLDLQDEP